MKKVFLNPLAEKDLEEIALFYEKRSARLGTEFLNAFERALEIILSNPEIGRTIERNIRRYVMQKFPFSIIYQTVDADVYVLAVLHQRQEPNSWKSRYQ